MTLFVTKKNLLIRRPWQIVIVDYVCIFPNFYFDNSGVCIPSRRRQKLFWLRSANFTSLSSQEYFVPLYYYYNSSYSIILYGKVLFYYTLCCWWKCLDVCFLSEYKSSEDRWKVVNRRERKSFIKHKVYKVFGIVYQSYDTYVRFIISKYIMGSSVI